MDGAQLSRFPNLSWLGYSFEAPADTGRCSWHLNGCAHALHLVFSGPQRVQWISRGREIDYLVRQGSFHYLPADDEPHEIIALPTGPIRSFTLFLPRHHITDVAAADHMEPRVELHRLLVHDDLVLQKCMTRLAAMPLAADTADASRQEEAARRLVLRLCELSGARPPDWHEDTSVFDRRTLAALVDYIDSHLRMVPSLHDMAVRVGLSPSHFARKFRHTVGLSLHRFVNRRRLRRSLELLRNPAVPLAGVSLDLGFASQSHFTRLFSDLTGMTPAKYQKQFRPTMG